MRRPRPAAVATLLIAVLSASACGSSGRAGPPASQPGSTGSTGSTREATTTTSTVAWAALSLRGSRLSGFTCPPPSASGPGVEVAASAVTEVLICPLEMPNPGGAGARTVRLLPTSPGFRPLLTALAAPDEPRQPGQICPLYADVMQPVVAATISGAVLVHIPVDSCGHYQGGAREALSAARGG